MIKIKVRETLVKVSNKRRRSSKLMKRAKKVMPTMKMILRRRMRTRMKDEMSLHERPDNKHTLCLLAVFKHLILAVYNLITLYLITIIN